MLVGVVLISGVVGSEAYGADPPLGVVLGVATAVCYAGFLLTIRRAGRDPNRPAGLVAIATAMIAVSSLAAGSLIGDLDLAPAASSLVWLVLLGVTAQSAGYLLISISLPRLPAIVTSVILLAQPVITVGLGMVLLSEAPSPTQLLGVVLVIGGIAAATVPLARVRDGWRRATTAPIAE